MVNLEKIKMGVLAGFFLNKYILIVTSLKMVWCHVTPICNKIGPSFYYGHPPVKAIFWVHRVALVEEFYYIGLKCRNVLNVFVSFS